MSAAIQAADETVVVLLSKGASPDLMDNYNATALEHAIQSKCSSTITLGKPSSAKTDEFLHIV